MLAGKIRLKTFLWSVGLGLGGLALLGTGITVVGGYAAVDAAADAVSEREAAARPPAPSPEPQAKPKAAPFERDVDADGVPYLGKDLGSPKAKDVTSGKRYKINVYQDEGHATVNRLKVDLDRDEKWDESWTFADGGITRKVAPADDEDYTREERWDGRRWISTSKEALEPEPVAPAGLDPVQASAMSYKGKSIGTEKLKDVTKGKPYKINVYQDAGQATANRVKLDLDRDDQWDESWTFDGDSVTRKVSPNDDGDQTETYFWTDMGWATAK